jgi:hypothetical protein
LRKQSGQFGEREVFQVVFEILKNKADGTSYFAWSKPFTPKLHEKSNFRKFLRDLLGRDLTQDEFDTETLVGMMAQIVVIQEEKDGKKYSRIVSIRPDKSGTPFLASGNYVRVKDRQPGAAPSGGKAYHQIEQPADTGDNLGATKIHVGKCTGMEVRELSPEQVQALATHWLAGAKANPNQSADDKRLIAALEWRQRQNGEMPF